MMNREQAWTGIRARVGVGIAAFLNQLLRFSGDDGWQLLTAQLRPAGAPMGGAANALALYANAPALQNIQPWQVEWNNGLVPPVPQVPPRPLPQPLNPLLPQAQALPAPAQQNFLVQ